MTKKEQLSIMAKNILLKNHIKPSDTITIVIKSVSPSGMYRRMRVYDKKMRDITGYVADLIDNPINGVGIGVSGCGMDMTFWLADIITHRLWSRDKKPKSLKGNGGGNCGCLDWRVL